MEAQLLNTWSGQSVYFDDLTYTISFAPPGLTIAKTAAAEALLQWPTNYTGFVVQSALSLGSGLWQAFSGAVTVNGTNYNVSVGTTNPARLFRLRKPLSRSGWGSF